MTIACEATATGVCGPCGVTFEVSASSQRRAEELLADTLIPSAQHGFPCNPQGVDSRAHAGIVDPDPEC